MFVTFLKKFYEIFSFKTTGQRSSHYIFLTLQKYKSRPSRPIQSNQRPPFLTNNPQPWLFREFVCIFPMLARIFPMWVGIHPMSVQPDGQWAWPIWQVIDWHSDGVRGASETRMAVCSLFLTVVLRSVLRWRLKEFVLLPKINHEKVGKKFRIQRKIHVFCRTWK